MQAGAQHCSYHKVALLFLTVGPMPHERLWTRWLQRANGLLPLEFLQQPLCTEERLAQLRMHCQLQTNARERAGLSNPADEQFLFSIYIHSRPDYPGEPDC